MKTNLNSLPPITALNKGDHFKVTVELDIRIEAIKEDYIGDDSPLILAGINEYQFAFNNGKQLLRFINDCLKNNLAK